MKNESINPGVPSGKFRETIEKLNMYRSLTLVAIVANCTLIALYWVYL
jgi:hypothetical protein